MIEYEDEEAEVSLDSTILLGKELFNYIFELTTDIDFTNFLSTAELRSLQQAQTQSLDLFILLVSIKSKVDLRRKTVESLNTKKQGQKVKRTPPSKPPKPPKPPKTNEKEV